MKQLITSIGNGLGRINEINSIDRSSRDVVVGYEVMNRNARKPNGPNKGKRPCSRIGRRAKRSKYGNSRRK